jgi:hypothetical protein
MKFSANWLASSISKWLGHSVSSLRVLRLNRIIPPALCVVGILLTASEAKE